MKAVRSGGARKRLTLEDVCVNTFATVFCVGVLLMTLYPIYFCLVNSFSAGVTLKGFWVVPDAFTLENYVTIFRNQNLAGVLLMTVCRVVAGMFFGVMVTSMAAFALSKRWLALRRAYGIFFIITMYFSGGMITTYLVLLKLKLIDTFWVYILPFSFSYFYALLFMAYFREIPEAVEEAASIDGAGTFYTYWRIIFPMSKPITATITLFYIVMHWNDWFAPAFYTNNEALMTLPAVLMRLLNATSAQQMLNNLNMVSQGAMVRSLLTIQSLRYATIIIAITPLAVIYPFVQKYFISGIMVGSIKA